MLLYHQCLLVVLQCLISQQQFFEPIAHLTLTLRLFLFILFPQGLHLAALPELPSSALFFRLLDEWIKGDTMGYQDILVLLLYMKKQVRLVSLHTVRLLQRFSKQ